MTSVIVRGLQVPRKAGEFEVATWVLRDATYVHLYTTTSEPDVVVIEPVLNGRPITDGRKHVQVSSHLLEDEEGRASRAEYVRQVESACRETAMTLEDALKS